MLSKKKKNATIEAECQTQIEKSDASAQVTILNNKVDFLKNPLKQKSSSEQQLN